MKDRYSPHKEEFWEFSTGVKETLFLDEVLNLIYDNFNSRTRQIVDFQANNVLNIKIFVVMKIYNNDNPAIFLDKKMIGFLNCLNAELDIDIYNN